ncbi:MAG TPA: nuclear transport factor 2 family protein [Anaerolineales bacterium]|nr:nuclear transport factor 2 family protein [Anaerolineales bacterium]HNF94626.1 nuclear transport factor 2 family protein [Anaerolineales bacterium]HNH27425.1 nuclear transport factor 2 family protein [Anaerolineales bacterium]HNO95277.1 nuclear transport factor 2 family protein [Anaerolineales bacterium]
MNPKQVLETFWEKMESNDFYAVAELLHDEFTLEWHQSGELIRGRENFAKINTAYPANGEWRFNINSIVAEGDVVVTDVSVTDGVVKDRVITFSTVRDGKIWKQIEFWPEPFAAPEWRARWVEKI